MEQEPSLAEMVDTLAKTFVIAHDGNSDEHLAQALVFNAGRLAWRIREQGLEVEQKTSVSDVVTQADRSAERFVNLVLENLRPDDGILGEEGAERESKSGRMWVVDPVDGTYNFTSGSDYWCSALALKDAEGVVFGAVHRPAMGYTWFGGRDYATRLDGTEVHKLSGATPEQTSLCCYLHPPAFSEPEVFAAWNKVASQFATIRMLGAGSVDLASVACGTWGAWMQHSVHEWDWLPGKALVEAAGGAARKVNAGGAEWCIAGSKQVVDRMETLLNG